MSDAMPTPEEIKAREDLGLETQPPPVHNDHPSSHDVAIALLGQRFAEAQEHMSATNGGTTGPLPDSVARSALPNTTLGSPGVELIVRMAGGTGGLVSVVIRPVGNSISSVLGRGAVTEVAGAIIRLDSIEMADLETFGLRSVVGKGDENVDAPLDPTATVDPDLDGRVPVFVQEDTERASVLGLADGDDPVRVVNEVTGESRNGVHSKYGTPVTTEAVEAAQAHMAKSKSWGLEKYKTILQPDNGRDSLQDLIEELGDALVYAITARAQREIDKERYRKALADAWADGHTKGWTDHAEPGYNTPTPNPYRTEAKEWTWDPDGDTQTVEEHLASPEFGAPCFSCGRRRHDKAVEKCYYC